MTGTAGIEKGTAVVVTDAGGRTHRMVAIDRPERGRDFPVVWVTSEAEYARATAADDTYEGVPWPLDSVRVEASS